MIEALDFKDVLLIPADISGVSSRKDVSIRPGTFSAANMEHCGTFETAKALAKHGWWTYIHKHYSFQEWYNMAMTTDNGVLEWMVPTVGADPGEINDLIKILALGPFKRVCVDVANGHSIDNIEALKNVIEKVSAHGYAVDFVYGNVANPHVLKFLPSNVIVKVGIGSGSHCTTRLKTGVGVPQFTLLNQFADVAWRHRIISDGGIRNPGDAVKALVAGASEVMLGGILGGYDETSPHVYGSASEYSSSFKNNHYSTAEGIRTVATAKGNISNLVKDYEGGMRSACAYLGVYKSNDLVYNKDIELIKVNRQVDNFS